MRASMASDERGVELTRLSSEVRLTVDKKMASADLRSVLVVLPAFAAIRCREEKAMQVGVSTAVQLERACRR